MSRRPGGDFDYDAHGRGYATVRRTDSRIAAYVHAALDDARVILNVGAGAGSYEPEDRFVIPIEPSAQMRAQRPPHLARAVAAVAERLPLKDQAVDAAMAIFTVHQWANLDRGLSELRRVTRGPIVVMTFDGDEIHKFWLNDYAPELIAAERKRYPKIDLIRQKLGRATSVTNVPIPIDCVDGFNDAFYARPEKFLDPLVRKSQSGWGFVAPEAHERVVKHLTADLESGAWDKRYGYLRHQKALEGSLRLIVAAAQ